jgi:hypothetical protein
MITLYSYPELFGVADNNPYGLKIFAFLKLCRIPFEHRHILDVSGAPRAQLPYIDDDGAQVGDSDRIIAYLIHKYGFFANIYFYEIETPLKIYAAACPRLARHCLAVHAEISSKDAIAPGAAEVQG